MFQGPTKGNVTWLRDMTNDELRSQLIARGFDNFAVTQIVSDAVNGDGSAEAGFGQPVFIMLFANENLMWDLRVRES